MSSTHWQLDQLLKPDQNTSLPSVFNTNGSAPYGYNGDPSASATSLIGSLANYFYNTFPATTNGATNINPLNLASAGNLSSSGLAIGNQYEIMAMAAQPRTSALGVISGPVQNLNTQDLRAVWPADTFPAADYSEHPWHSAEFRFDNMMMDGYWNALLGPTGLKINSQ